MKIFIVLVVVFPLIGFIVNRFLGRRLGEKFVSLVGPSVIGLSSLFAGVATVLANLNGYEKIVVRLFPWIHIGYFNVDIAFLFDPLSSWMMLLVTFVSFLIHIYSIGYMKGDRNYNLYFSYLNLFVFMMLMLVAGANILLLFLGWEGVGLCSYLLIGFWFEEIERARAGFKAFVVNRIGDFAFLLGILLLFWTTWEVGNPTLSYESLQSLAGKISPGIITAICLLFFTGATGKSAQIPLYVWLPDAMAGPTPVSALIHAATMVTAGVYMISRLNFLYSLSQSASIIVATVGVLTALFAATMALVSRGIKKVLAYSTISQLGYMFLGVGVGTYVNGMFHLTTHAFFKALLFLGAGSVMHAMNDEEDILKMGGLRKYIPHTFWTFSLGALALAGIPPFAGFFSKDEILLKTFEGGHYILYGIGMFTAFLTAFYTFRLVFLVFYGKERFDVNSHHPHESPKTMVIPMAILAVLSLLGGGLLGFPHHSLIEKYLEPAVLIFKYVGEAPEVSLIVISIAVALSGGLLAYVMYITLPDLPQKIISNFKGIYNLLWNKYWVDEIYYAVFLKNALRFSFFLRDFDLGVIDLIVNLSAKITVYISKINGLFDLRGIDGAVNLIADETVSAGGIFRRIQTGIVQNYLLVFAIGLLGFLAYKILFGG